MRAGADLVLVLVIFVAAAVGGYFAYETWLKPNAVFARYEAERTLSGRFNPELEIAVMRRIRENNIYMCQHPFTYAGAYEAEVRVRRGVAPPAASASSQTESASRVDRQLPPLVHVPTLQAQLAYVRERYRGLCEGSHSQNRARCNRAPVQERCTFNPTQLTAQEKVACHMNQGMVANCVPSADVAMRNACVAATRTWIHNPREDNPNINQSETNNTDVHNISWRRAEVCRDVYGVTTRERL